MLAWLLAPHVSKKAGLKPELFNPLRLAEAAERKAAVRDWVSDARKRLPKRVSNPEAQTKWAAIQARLRHGK